MRSLNKETFNQGLLNRIEKVITDYSLIDPDEKVAVALSGGKDSVLTLHALIILEKSLTLTGGDLPLMSGYIPRLPAVGCKFARSTYQ